MESGNEFRFCIGIHEIRRRVRRRCGEKNQIQFVLERKTTLTRGVMVWGTMLMERFIFFNANVNYQTLEKPIFQQNNTRSHAAGVTTRYLREADVDHLPWLVKSHDLLVIVIAHV
ncbi:hypothetical protein ABEB36_012742 [Hypothenemus hampei]|uniref:Uncharacterized protein n=1 Tax=Hypothenemus hampei TaxID=57062 RepID=A0ABD1EC92_HYPHA